MVDCGEDGLVATGKQYRVWFEAELLDKHGRPAGPTLEQSQLVRVLKVSGKYAYARSGQGDGCLQIWALENRPVPNILQ